MTVPLQNACVLHEMAAPPGWTAALLEANLPLTGTELEDYRKAADELRRALDATVEAPHRELFLLFERCRPSIEIPRIQGNARWWMPQFGMGVWLDRDAPTTWSAEEFSTATPATLRPVIDRVLRISREPQPQEAAWRSLAGSGALLSVSSAMPGAFLEQSTNYLLPRITDPSLTSFPFYVPLLTAASLVESSPDFDAPLDELLPQTEVYLRESVEDGGLLVLVRRDAASFWDDLKSQTLTSLHLHRNAIPPGL